MSSASPIVSQSVGRTFVIAISLLGLLALTQLGAASWVFFQRFRTLAENAVAPGKARSSPGTSGPLASGEESDRLDTADGFPAGIATAGARKPIAPPPKPEPVSPEELNPPPGPPETRLEELVQQGRALRQRGDMTASLIRFKEASALDPSSPETIAEIAMTYEKMSMLDQAAREWKRIYDMGDAAGSYYIAAESRLKMSQVEELANAKIAAAGSRETGPVSNLRPDAVLGLGEIDREDRPAEGALLRFALRVPIRAKAGAGVNVQDVDVFVLFYDQLDPKTVVQTSADTRYKFVSSPVDWLSAEPEVLEVEYDAPVPLGKGPKTEERKYFGYVVRIYYQGELQDTRAEPETLNARFPAPQFLDKTEPSK